MLMNSLVLEVGLCPHTHTQSHTPIHVHHWRSQVCNKVCNENWLQRLGSCISKYWGGGYILHWQSRVSAPVCVHGSTVSHGSAPLCVHGSTLAVTGLYPCVSMGPHWQSSASTHVGVHGSTLIVTGQYHCGCPSVHIDSHRSVPLWVSMGPHWQSWVSTPVCPWVHTDSHGSVPLYVSTGSHWQSWSVLSVRQWKTSSLPSCGCCKLWFVSRHFSCC